TQVDLDVRTVGGFEAREAEHTLSVGEPVDCCRPFSLVRDSVKSPCQQDLRHISSSDCLRGQGLVYRLVDEELVRTEQQTAGPQDEQAQDDEKSAPIHG